MPINADANGKLTCKFTIPAGIPSGKKRVTLQGDDGTFGETFFEGKGELWEESVNTLKNITNVTNIVTTNYHIAGWYGKRWYDYPYQWKKVGTGSELVLGHYRSDRRSFANSDR